MLLVKPSFEIASGHTGAYMLQALERAGRTYYTCYKSEDRITDDSAVKFAQDIIKRGHESVLEHEKITVRVVCDRGVSHEIVRHRLASYSQESTRYCNYKGGVTFVIPPWWHEIPEGDYTYRTFQRRMEHDEFETCPDARHWLNAMLDAEEAYTEAVDRLKWSPQKARSVLPNSLKTEVVMTLNIRAWRHFFNLRTAVGAHPQMREIAQPMLAMFRTDYPILFDDVGSLL